MLIYEIVLFSSFDSMKESADLVEEMQEGMLEYLHLLNENGVPPSILKLKTGCICSIMRNLSVEKGLVKNARVKLVDSRRNCVKVQLIDCGSFHWIPRITFEFHPERCPWTIVRRQIPLRLAYATTFNSCQGLTLDRVVVDLRTPVFAHGQLYTALSRTRRRNDCIALIDSESRRSPPVVVNMVSKLLLS